MYLTENVLNQLHAMLYYNVAIISSVLLNALASRFLAPSPSGLLINNVSAIVGKEAGHVVPGKSPKGNS